MEYLLEPGDRYDGFEILAEIGSGSFAQVYAVRAAGLAKPVALKLSRTEVESEDMALRALREIRILESLRNFVPAAPVAAPQPDAPITEGA